MKKLLNSFNQISHLALDIETVPSRALTDYESHVQDYIKRKVDKARATDPSMTYEKFASLNPNFGRIVCLTVGYIAENAEGDQVMRLKSYTGGEEDILHEFNHCVAKFSNTFVHYNGRSFDVPFILTRMRLLRMRCLNPNFENLNRPNGCGHLDLMEYHSHNDSTKRLPLSVIASLTGLPSPKGDLDGSKIWEAFQNEEIRRIARYCEWDVATNLNLLRILVGGYEAIPCERFYSVEVDDECGHLAHAGPDGRCPSIDDERKAVFLSAEGIRGIGRGSDHLPEAPGETQSLAPANPRFDWPMKIGKDDLKAWINVQNGVNSDHGI